MDCEKIRELILADYIDNAMSDEGRIRLNIHLAHCQECKEFCETAKNTIVKPFANVKKIEPAGFIWYRVKEAIIAKQQKKLGFAASLLEKLKSVFSIPRPALAMSTLMALVLVVVLTAVLRFSNKEVLGISGEEQAEYFIYSIETPVSVFLNNDGGFGTLVEKYLL